MKAHDWQSLINRYYPVGSPLRDIYLRHCGDVARKALEIAHAAGLTLDPREIEAAAMIHDIGIVATDAPSIHCHGELPYICHGVEGARMLRAAGAPESWARVAETHTGSGLTAAEIEAQQLPIPRVDFLPVTELEQLICLADKFYSKGGSGEEKSFERARQSVARHGEAAASRFDAMAHTFGLM